MRLTNLIESNIKDIYNENFHQFLLDYSNIYDKSLFVYFSNDSQLKFNDINDFSNIPSGMTVFPLSFVINNPEEFSEYANRRFVYIVKITDKILNIKNIRFAHIEQLASILNIEESTLEEYMDNLQQSFNLSTSQFYSHIFHNLLWSEIKHGNIEHKKIAPSYVTERLIKMGYSAIVDFSTKPSESVLSNTYPSVGIIIKSTAFKEYDKYDIEKTEDDKSNNDAPYFRDKYEIQELARKIANAIGTKLNKDEPYVMFLDFFYWTVEGIQIQITEAFGNKTEEDSDNVYHVIEMKTPFGTLIHSSNISDTYDDVAKDVAKHYSAMQVSVSDWEPQNRDKFMTGIRKHLKIMDEQSDEIVDTVNKYYPRLRKFARAKGIYLPILEYYSNYDKLFINDLLERFIQRPEPNKLNVIETMEENNFDFNMFLFRKLPPRITVSLIKKIAQVYDIGQRKFPGRKGWYVFKDL